VLDSSQDRDLVVDSCEHGNEASCSVHFCEIPQYSQLAFQDGFHGVTFLNLAILRLKYEKNAEQTCLTHAINMNLTN
jgi:hypothetical protein